MIVIDKKTIVIGLIAIAVSQSALAGTTVRDHRGDKTAAHPVKPLKFTGTRGGHDPGWGNYGPKKGTGNVVVRDHRH
jgi:hypothetical protein